MDRIVSVRHSAALGVAAVGIEAVLSAITPDDPSRHRLVRHIAPPALPSAAHLLALLVGLALVVLTPKLWRGTRAAVSLAISALLVLAVLNIVKGLDYEESALELCLALVLALGRRAFLLGSRNRPRLALASAAVGMWALSYCALLIKPLAIDRGHTIKGALHRTIGQALHASLGAPRLSHTWILAAEVLIGSAVVTSVLTVRSLLRPSAGVDGHSEHEYRAARAIVERHGVDSLSPFVLRPDKAFHFDGEGMLAYRVIGETAIVSSDPVAPDGEAPKVLSSFLKIARERGWQVVLWGASARHLDAYRELGLRVVCAGEEAFVDPSAFTLNGRRVRKLRQSVHRVERRGWQISVCEGRELDAGLESEIDAVEASWRAGKARLLGFAMGMGVFDPDMRPDDLYVLARSPDGELRAVMRFVAHCGKLSLDTMRRVGETPNGLNEALVCRALDVACDHGVVEVSLNYAGLAHLVRGESRRRVTRVVLAVLSRRFQLERLVRFNEKFLPVWRPRFLLYEPSGGLPRAALRILQAEGYLPQRNPSRSPAGSASYGQALAGTARADVAR